MRRRNSRWLLRYTGLYLCVLLPLALIMLRYGRTLIWNPDGVKQPYTVFGYMGNALRGLLKGEGWRMMDFSLGQGMDLLMTMTYYGYTDPFTLLSALAQNSDIEWVYMLTDVLRAWLNAVASVKYFIQRDGDHYVVPTGFEPAGTLSLQNGKASALYQNTQALPFAYAYDATMSKATYDTLSVEDRFQALSSFAIVDEPVSNVPEQALNSAAVSLPFEINEQVDVSIEERSIRAGTGGYAKLSFEAPEAPCEIFLILDGLSIVSGLTNGNHITVEAGGGQSAGSMLPRSSNFYFPREGMAFCLGSEAGNSCEIRFIDAAAYTYESMRVVAIPTDTYFSAMEARRAEVMTDIDLSNDRINGRITTLGDRVLQVAVPYSDGWSAWVDGEKVDVFRCGGMYMGIALAAGEHAIEMRYVTPGLIPGAAISAAALLATIALAILSAARRRRRRKEVSA